MPSDPESVYGQAAALVDRGLYRQGWAVLDALRGTPLSGHGLVLRGSTLRQIGLHQEAADQDTRALASADPPTGFWAHLGLAADSVGLFDRDRMQGHLREARDLLPAAEADTYVRGQLDPRAALAWVEAEAYLLNGAARSAVRVLQESRERGGGVGQSGAGRARQAHHETKTSLFLAAAHLTAGDRAAGIDLLTVALEAAVRSDLAPLVWPAALQLRREDPTIVPQADHLARAALHRIATSLPPPARGRWQPPIPLPD